VTPATAPSPRAAREPPRPWPTLRLGPVVPATVSLFIRSPADLHTAGWRLVTGLTLLFLLASAIRVGYII